MSKITNFPYPTLILTSSLGVNPFELLDESCLQKLLESWAYPPVKT